MTVLGFDFTNSEELNAFTVYTGTGSRTFFEYGFAADENTPVVVVVDGDPVDYTQQATGVVIEPAPELGGRIVIYRWSSVDQLLDWQPFESFDAAKTEFACDKLILLKQEAWQYRAWLILFADHQQDRIRLINYHGDDADIFLWGTDRNAAVLESEAGAFAGLVSDEIPQAGAVVEKPWDFVYFQCDQEQVIAETYVTSTLYPIVGIEALAPSIATGQMSMTLIPQDDADQEYVVLSADLSPGLISYGPEQDDVDQNYVVTGAVFETTLLSYGPNTDDADQAYVLLSGTFEVLLVTIYIPNEGLDTSCVLNTTNCSMTLV